MFYICKGTRAKGMKWFNIKLPDEEQTMEGTMDLFILISGDRNAKALCLLMGAEPWCLLMDAEPWHLLIGAMPWCLLMDAKPWCLLMPSLGTY